MPEVNMRNSCKPPDSLTSQIAKPLSGVGYLWRALLAVLVGTVLSGGPSAFAQAQSDEIRRVVDALARPGPVYDVLLKSSVQPSVLVDAISNAIEVDARFQESQPLQQAYTALSHLRAADYETGFRALLAGLRRPETRTTALMALATQSDPMRRPEIVASVKQLIEQGLSVNEISRLVKAIGQLGPSASELLPHVRQVFESPEVGDRDRGFALKAIAQIGGGEAALHAWEGLELRNPELLLYLAEFAAETDGTLNAAEGVRHEFRRYVLEMIGSADPKVRRNALETVSAAYGREAWVRTADGWRLNQELEERLSEVAQTHTDTEWRGRVSEVLGSLRANAERLATKWERRDRREQSRAETESGAPAPSPAFVLPFEFEWPSDGATPHEWRKELQKAVRRLIEARCGATGRELSAGEKRNLDLHVRLWSEPVDHLREPLLTRDGAMWYLESTDAFQAWFIDAPKRPPPDELQRAIRTLQECGLADQWVAPPERASRQENLLDAVSSLVEVLRIPARSFRLAVADGSALDEAAHEKAILSLSTKAAMRRARVVSTNIFFAKSASYLEKSPVWAVVVRNILDDLRSKTSPIRLPQLEEALPSLVDAAFWNPQAGECSQRMYREVLQATRRLLSGESAASPLP